MANAANFVVMCSFIDRCPRSRASGGGTCKWSLRCTVENDGVEGEGWATGSKYKVSLINIRIYTFISLRIYIPLAPKLYFCVLFKHIQHPMIGQILP